MRVFSLACRGEFQCHAATVGRADLTGDETRFHQDVDQLRSCRRGEAKECRDVREHGILVPAEKGQGPKLRDGKLRAAACADLQANDPHQMRDRIQNRAGAFVWCREHSIRVRNSVARKLIDKRGVARKLWNCGTGNRKVIRIGAFGKVFCGP